MKYADVLLPLMLPKNYTFSVPEDINNIRPGCRVAVQFGRQRKYAAIVKKIHEQAPKDYKTKPLLHLLDEKPVVHPLQLQFWEWLADYYCCTEGEVMNAALPAHLKLSSETILLYNPVYGEDFSELNDDEFIIAEALLIRKELSVEEVQQLLDKAQVYNIINSLIEKRLCLVYEELKEAYKPKLEKFVSLSEEYNNDEKMAVAFEDLQRAPRQQEILMAYIQLNKTTGLVRRQELLERAGAQPAQLKALEEKGIFIIKEERIDRLPSGKIAADIDFELNEMQQAALQKIKDLFNEQQVVLLHGVTSSGKTMLYIQLIEQMLTRDKQVLYLLPEIALTTQIIRRLQKHFGDKIGIYHSRFSNNERVEIWNKVKNGELRIVLGARSALLLPFKELGLVIIDEEHDSSFKQHDPAPRYHARDAAIYYAGLSGAKVLLGSATPAVESYYNAQQGKYGLVEMPERFGGALMPQIEIIDIKKETAEKKATGHFSSLLKSEIEIALRENKQAILFQNRRGYAPFLICTTCGWVPQCDYCDVSLTYHKFKHQLHCHYCGRKYPMINQCKACGNTTMATRNFGTEKIEDDLSDMFPKSRIIRLDLDAIRAKDAHQKIINLFEQHRIDILVGTQMVVKGLDFENVKLVGILNADSLLHYPEFRVNERAFQLMEQVSGRAGRKDVPGKVIIQASDLKNPVLQYVVDHDYLAMYNNELIARKNFYYPPYCRLIKITLRHKKEDLTDQAAKQLFKLLYPRLGNRLFGPATPLIARVRNNYLREMLIKLPKGSAEIAAIKSLMKEKFIELQTYKSCRSVRIIADVDPI